MLAEIRGSTLPRVEASPPRTEQIPYQLDELIQLQQEVIREQRPVAALRKILLTELRDFIHNLKSCRAASQPVETSQKWIDTSEVEKRHNPLSETTDLNLPQLISDTSLFSPSDSESSYLHQPLRASSVRTLDSTTEEAYGRLRACNPLQDLAVLTPSMMLYPEKLLDSQSAKEIAFVQAIVMKSIPGPIIPAPIIPVSTPISCSMKFLGEEPLYCDEGRVPLTFVLETSARGCGKIDWSVWIHDIPPHPPPTLLLSVLTPRSKVAFETTNIARKVAYYFNDMDPGDQRDIVYHVGYMHKFCLLVEKDSQVEVTEKMKATEKDQRKMTKGDIHSAWHAEGAHFLVDPEFLSIELRLMKVAMPTTYLLKFLIKIISTLYDRRDRYIGNISLADVAEEEISSYNAAVKDQASVPTRAFIWIYEIPPAKPPLLFFNFLHLKSRQQCYSLSAQLEAATLQEYKFIMRITFGADINLLEITLFGWVLEVPPEPPPVRKRKCIAVILLAVIFSAC